jgi:23S rRNA (guanosine2251-2'-O)-methyltransferase
MPPRKPFRPDKNRDRGRTQHGSRDAESSHSAGNRDNRSQERNNPSGRDRRHADERASAPRNSLESADSKSQRDRAPSRDEAQSGFKASGGSYWIYGNHAVAAAIDNPNRRIRRLLQAHPEGEKAVRGAGDRPLPRWETVDRAILDRVAGRESVHQGIAAQVDPLPETDIEDIAALAADRPEAKVVILDQVTDPHNVGAILRSAAAFGALAVVLTERNAAPESGVLAKAASGALEVVPLVRVTNLARAIEQLKGAGFWCAGLAAEGERSLAEARLSGRVALCLGAEGAGLRRLTRSHCDLLVRLPTSGPIDHLNVSNAAAVALYELSRGG